MKPNCSLNNIRANDYDIETKKQICSACIDSDHTDCEQGTLNITAYRNQQRQEMEAKKKLISIIIAAQEDIKQELKNLQ